MPGDEEMHKSNFFRFCAEGGGEGDDDEGRNLLSPSLLVLSLEDRADEVLADCHRARPWVLTCQQSSAGLQEGARGGDGKEGEGQVPPRPHPETRLGL